MPALSRLIFGGAALSALPSRGAALRLLEAAVAGGVTHFDTARAYGRGYSEKLLGDLLQDQSGLHVTSKVGLGAVETARIPPMLALPLNYWRKRLRPPHPPVAAAVPTAPQTPPRPLRLDGDYVRASLDESFRQLGVSRIDVLLLHENIPSNLDDTTLDYLLGLQREGTIGRLGVGTDARVLAAHYEPVEGFSVLQYSGPASLQGRDLRALFPDHEHFTYGWFQEAAGRRASDVMRDALEYDPAGRVLFSTRSERRLQENLLAAKQA